MRPSRLAAAAAVVLAAGLLPAVGFSTAGAAPDGTPYRPIQGFKASGDKVRVTPKSFSAVRVNLDEVRADLRSAPAEGSGGGLTFEVPAPSGGTERFSVTRTTLMEPELAAANPEIVTYAGRSLEHEGISIALDVTPMGFHAAVRGSMGQRAWYVDPAYDRRGTSEHLVYYGASVQQVEDSFAEREAPAIRKEVATMAKAQDNPPGGTVTQRTYRLALTSDPTYADYFGAGNVLAEKVTLINRVNQIYTDDLAIDLVLIDETDKLNLDTEAEATGADGPCGAHPCFDPADPSDPDSFSQLDFCDVPTLGRNRTVLGQLVDAGDYDIGHVALGVNGGGIAYLAVVGQDYKGGGCTGLPEPKGDFFAIDYVAHEFGHQFAGNHTFNGVQFACSGGNRNAGTSVEPGSGSSVMAYAGICLQDDLQPHTDPYFSGATHDEVNAYTDNPANDVVEVQTVSLRNFDTDGDRITLRYRDATPVTLTRGVDYDRAGITAAVTQLTGEPVTIAGWGYDPYGGAVYPALLTEPDDTGFQVIFAPTPAPDAPGDYSNKQSLMVSSNTEGVSGFVGETAKGGPADNGGSTITETDNRSPRITRIRKTRTVPVRTPFTLLGKARDADGDGLSYLWEQLDVGPEDSRTSIGGTSLVDNRKIFGPLFRVFGTAANVTDEGTLQSPSPGLNVTTNNPTRNFPDMRQIITGNTNAATGRCPEPPPVPDDLADYEPVAPRIVECFSEFLPTRRYLGSPDSAPRVMHFRLTTRDGEGGVAFRNTTLRVDPEAGPFQVTSQRRNVTFDARDELNVRWNVNGTRRLAEHVRIMVSVNNGRTWRYTAARATPNDGFKRIQVPNRDSKRVRIMVDANQNYFFDVNDSKFTIRKR